jgi:superfamily II DNA or RNA helicase
MLVLGSGSSSDRLSQLIGRIHRTGQLAEQAEVSFFVSCLEDLRALHKARTRAEYDKRMGRNNASKLLACDWLVPSLQDARKWKGPRWEM